jgi:uncharacterized protein (TIGR00725 family)
MKLRPYQICVSGAAAGETVQTSKLLAQKLGESIAKHEHTLLTGATIGLPYHAALGAKKAGGLSIGFSPAGTYREHVNTYKLPTDAFDFINFTGMDYVGRDVHLVRSAEAVITVGGRMGSLHEFSTAIESHKVCAILLGSGGLADFLPTILDRVPAPGQDEIIYDNDPERIVKRVIEALDKKYINFHDPSEEMKEEAKHPTTHRQG